VKQHDERAKTIISEIDGSMVPIVKTSVPSDKTAEEVDLRKYRKLVYKEARLAYLIDFYHLCEYLAGAWSKDKNPANMLSLRVLRANDNWDSYWNTIRLNAA
jgi:hypothetical protein